MRKYLTNLFTVWVFIKDEKIIKEIRLTCESDIFKNKAEALKYTLLEQRTFNTLKEAQEFERMR